MSAAHNRSAPAGAPLNVIAADKVTQRRAP